MKVVAALRILTGVGAVAAGAWGLGTAISRVVHYTPIHGLDAPPPPSFSGDAAGCVLSFVLMLSGWAMTKGRWEILSHTCWFVLAILMQDSLYDWLTGWHSHAVNRHHVLALALIAVLVVCHAGLRNTRSVESPGKNWRLAAVLAGIASLVLVWRTGVFLTGGEAPLLWFHLRDETDPLAGKYAPHLASGITSSLMAAALVAAVVALKRHQYQTARVVLAIGMGLTLNTTLETLDAAFSIGETPLFATTVPEALAFWLCAAALAVLRPWRPPGRGR